MANFETPAQLTLRKSKEKRIAHYLNAKDGFHINEELDTYPYGQPRKELGAAAMYQALKKKGSKAARFFRKEAIAETTHQTEEMEVVVG